MVKMVQSKIIVIMLVILLLLTSCTNNNKNLKAINNTTEKVTISSIFKDKLRLKYDSYYYNNSYYYVENQSLYKQSLEGSNDSAVSLFKEIDDFSIIGISDNILYYVTQYNVNLLENNLFKIYSYNLNSNEKTSLINSSEHNKLKYEDLHNYCIFDNKIYIQMSWEFFAYDIDKKILKKQLNSVVDFQILNKTMYYKDANSNMKAVNFNDNKIKVVIKADKKINCTEFVALNNVIYFYSQATKSLYSKIYDKLTLIEKDAENKYIDSASLFINNQKLYYILELKKEKYLYEYDSATNKTKKIVICNDYSTGGKIIDGCFVYENGQLELQFINI